MLPYHVPMNSCLSLRFRCRCWLFREASPTAPPTPETGQECLLRRAVNPLLVLSWHFISPTVLYAFWGQDLGTHCMHKPGTEWISINNCCCKLASLKEVQRYLGEGTCLILLNRAFHVHAWGNNSHYIQRK